VFLTEIHGIGGPESFSWIVPSLLALCTNDVITGAVVEPVFLSPLSALGVNVILTGTVVVAVFVTLLPAFIIKSLIT
jgi:hypothetical protein